ncbi:MAG: RHS repeat domain-containing protein [Opitutales bacterium]
MKLYSSLSVALAAGALSALSGQLTAKEETKKFVPADAFKEVWVPPAPVKTKDITQPKRGARAQKPDVTLKLERTPSMKSLESARLLRKPLRATKEVPSEKERREVAKLLKRLDADGGHFNTANCAKIEKFVSDNPDSPFNVSLLLEKSRIEWTHGYFTLALDSLRDAWAIESADLTDEAARLRDIAFAELAEKLGNLGQREELRSLIAEAKERTLGGTAAEALIKAEEVLWFFDNQAEQNVFCGFTATNAVCVPLGHKPIFPDVHDEQEEREFIENGLSLYELRAHSHEAGGDIELYKRGNSKGIPVPSVIHWNFNHYSAITEQDGDLYRVKDFHLKVDTWVTLDALELQMSGYFAMSASVSVPAGFEPVDDAEAKTIFGRHCTHGRGDEGSDNGGGGNEDDCAMATYSFRFLNPGLELHDTPISYSPPYGPSINFKLNYDQRSTSIPDIQDFGNFGPRWTHNYLSYVDIVGSGTPASSVEVVFGDGTYFSYSYNTSAGTYTTAYGDRPRLDYIAAGAGGPAYQMTYNDGSIKIFGQGDSGSPTRFFLTEISDPQDNSVTLQYDANLRITSIFDALGQETTLSYTPDAGANVASDTDKIRSITDPFNRTALFKYTASGQLFQIIDPEGIVSEFSYDNGDFIDAFTTPYGTWTIDFGTVPNTTNNVNGLYIEVTDPYGDKERVEQFDASLSQYNPSGTETLAPSSVDVDGSSVSFMPKNSDLGWRNTFHWDKQQMQYHAGDYSKATVHNWLAENNTIVGVKASIKRPEEGRVWFNYPGQTSSHAPGTFDSPSKIVRAVEDETGTQTWSMSQNEYDANYGKLSKTIDPLGREVVYEYNPLGTVPGAITGIDLTAMKVKNASGSYETITSYSDYVGGLPQTITEASGLVTSYLYNTEGQTTQITLSKGGNSEVTKFIYDEDLDGTPDARGYLIEVQTTDPENPSGFVTVSRYTYDGFGRVRTETNVDGYTLTFDYDNFDRVTLISHPDTTTEQFVYKDLDLEAVKDRNGNWTRYGYDANRQLVFQQDPEGNITATEWCRCGDIRKVIDPKKNVTQWKRDAQGRPYEKIYPDGTKTTYTYQAHSGNLETITYANDQASGQPTVTYKYYIDGTLASADYTDPDTPDVSYAYNDPLARLTSHTDQLGTTAYSYVPFNGNQAGAGAPYETNGPWADDNIRFSYDWRNRLNKREILDDVVAVPGVLHSVEWQFDSLGRVMNEVNDLGTFTNVYNSGNLSARADAVQYPSSTGITASYDYYAITGSANDNRLKEIHYTGNGGSTLSKYSYEFDPAGRIKKWTQQQGATTAAIKHHTFDYDKASQLTEAVITNNGGTTLDSWSWQYDPAGNRQRESEGSGSDYSQYNNLNQLSQIGGDGTTLIEGTIDELALVNVNGSSAEVTSLAGGGFRFRKEVPVTEGSNTVTVEATDASGNTASQSYAITVGGVQKVLEYDLNGNLRYEKDSFGSVLREFQWDAKNRLIAIIDGAQISEFEYDGLDRRVRIIETENSVEVSNDVFIWIGGRIVQKRNATATALVRNFYNRGFSEGSSDYFLTKDHLGSIREVVAANGATVESRYEYNSWGEFTKTAGIGAESDFLYTGHLYHTESELFLAQYRAYNSENGRWLNRDPAGFIDGPNLYRYGLNDPIGKFDNNGLWVNFAIGAGIGLGFEAAAQIISGEFNPRALVVSTLTGALTGGVGAGIAKGIVGNGLRQIAGRGALNAGVGAGAGALGAAANCDDIVDGAVSGLVSGAAGSVLGDLGGSAARNALTDRYATVAGGAGETVTDALGDAGEIVTGTIISGVTSGVSTFVP